VALSTFFTRFLVRLEGKHYVRSLPKDFTKPWLSNLDFVMTREAVVHDKTIPNSNKAALIFLQETPF